VLLGSSASPGLLQGGGGAAAGSQGPQGPPPGQQPAAWFFWRATAATGSLDGVAFPPLLLQLAWTLPSPAGPAACLVQQPAPAQPAPNASRKGREPSAAALLAALLFSPAATRAPLPPAEPCSPTRRLRVPPIALARPPLAVMLACSASPQTDVIKEGDLVIVYESYASMKSAVVTRKGQFSNRYGNFKHEVRLLLERARAARQPAARSPRPLAAAPASSSGSAGWVFLALPGHEVAGDRALTPALPAPAGLDRQAVWQQGVLQAAEQGVGLPDRAHARAVEPGAAPQDADPVRGGHQPGLLLPGAAPRQRGAGVGHRQRLAHALAGAHRGAHR
jgi:hypothetical protein